MPIGRGYQQQIALGAPPPAVAARNAARFPVVMSDAEMDKHFEKIPAWYTISILLGGQATNTQTGTVQLRPEPFVLQRITWATTGDLPLYFASTPPAYSIQGRSVTIEWNDEFTKFMGNSPALISSVFGDSQGFLDLPRGALFQGSQTLSAKLTRLVWPTGDDPQTTRFDFTFTGLGLLPKGVAQSGSAG